MNRFVTPFIVFASVFGLYFGCAQTALAGGYFMQGTARWDHVPGAEHYHVYYKESGQDKYTHSVVHISYAFNSYLISYLKPGVRYWYNVVAIDRDGHEISWSGLKKLRVAWMP